MPDPLLPGRLGLYLSMVHYGLAHNRDFARENYEFFSRMREYVGDLEGRRVLDVGCGKSYWLSLLMHSAGARVTGVDTEVVEPGTSAGKYLRIWRANGFERSLRTFVWETIFARPYYRALAELCDFELHFDGLDLRATDGVRLDLPDKSIDLVVSHEVFEHIAELDKVLLDLKRVMKPQGRTYIYVHNYTSLSGGHHIAWKYPDTEPSRKVPPWDHLRQNRFADVPSWLNKLRIHDYRAAFERHFEILDWFETAREGEDLLTEELKNELAEYGEDELLTKGFVVVARPAKINGSGEP